ncbi:hypothetical protein [Pectobacterium brasiliense]|uniref:hypothetical protein n=1 Tax=Pectobacterium brasiliense TaxID=180957 RepID=UPI0019D3A9E0|nr:hypothetical protein [Pectobacterium brasiliense]MBN7764357.1 hypothetical protein [Pectobacterium brasiliense]
MMKIKNKEREKNTFFSVGRILNAKKIIVNLVGSGNTVKYKLWIINLNNEISCYLYYPDDYILNLIGKKISFIGKYYDGDDFNDILHIFQDY